VTSQHSKPKRWQFELNELFLLMVLVSTPIGLYRIALHLSFIPAIGMTLGLVAVSMAGGVITAVLAWALTGERGGFLFGYVVGVMLTPFAVAVLLEFVPIA
jgi:hypothetical protein